MVEVKVPKGFKPVLAQAYKSPGDNKDQDLDLVVPYDQAFQVEEGAVHFILEKNASFNIVFRDQANAVIFKTEISTGP